MLTHPSLHLEYPAKLSGGVPRCPQHISGSERAFSLINSLSSSLQYAHGWGSFIRNQFRCNSNILRNKPTCCLRAGLHNQLGKMLLFAITSLTLLLEVLLLPSTRSLIAKEGLFQQVVVSITVILLSPSWKESTMREEMCSWLSGWIWKKQGGWSLPLVDYSLFQCYLGLSSAQLPAFSYFFLTRISR